MNETASVLHLTEKLTQWINGLNVKIETIKFLDENTGSKFLDISLSDNFLNLTPKAKAIEEKKKQTSGTSSLKRFCRAENTTNNNEEAAYGTGETGKSYLIELISKAHIELTQQQKVKTPNNPIKRWMGLNNHLPKRRTDGQQVQKSCSMSLIIREMQVKTTISPHTCQKGY